jgi:hypothetical protein
MRFTHAATAQEAYSPQTGKGQATQAAHGPNATKEKACRRGEQRVLPSAEVAERRAAEPLQAKLRQRSADSGPSWDESKLIDLVDQPVTPLQAEISTASVSFMITQHQKEELRGLGYAEECIREMKPETAHTILKKRIKAS